MERVRIEVKQQLPPGSETFLPKPNGRVKNEDVIPNAEESMEFWSEIWNAKKIIKAMLNG